MCEYCGCSLDKDQHSHGKDIHSHKEEIHLGVDLLEHNRLYAEKNRRLFDDAGVFVVNVLGSPGAGKTTLLSKTLDALSTSLKIGIITGDLVGEEDKNRLSRDGVTIRSIQTGRVCHLDAHIVSHAAELLPLKDLDILFIENVGNLVCPALFHLGEHRRAVILSVAEGDDKPSKYPEIFRLSDITIISKIDLGPYVNFDTKRVETDIRRLRFTMEILRLSAVTGNGFDLWISWLNRQIPDNN